MTETYFPYAGDVPFYQYLMLPVVSELSNSEHAYTEYVSLIMQSSDFKGDWVKYRDSVMNDSDVQDEIKIVNDEAVAKGIKP